MIVKKPLSGGLDGRNIKIAATATPGTLLHTGPAVGAIDEVYLYALNTSASDVTLTVQWGGVTSPDDHVVVVIAPDQGAYLVVPGWVLLNEREIRAFASSADVVNVNGYVNRIYQE